MIDLPNGLRDLLDGEGRSSLERDVLPAYLRQRRWFASKDKRIDGVRLAQASIVTFENGDLLFSEVEIQLDGRQERYQLVMGLYAEQADEASVITRLKLADVKWNNHPAILTDAFALDLLPLGLIGAIRSQAVLAMEFGAMRCIALSGLADIDLSGAPSIRRIAAEQSNSSVIIGDAMIMKLIRRVMYGVNPEVEMVRYLTENEYANTPPLLGEVQSTHAGGPPCSLVVVQKFIPNQGDAWEWTLNVLKNDATAGFDGYQRFAGAMGTRLAQLHAILAKPTDIEAFKPHECGDIEVAAWAEAARTQLEAAFLILEKLSEVERAKSPDAALIIEQKAAVLDILPKLAKSGGGSLLTRIHGDFHLGQILVANEDAFIIDFEGEPAKPLEIRRAKSSPMRDVAGLLRSLHYAAATIGMATDDFIHQSSATFLKSYRLVEQSARWRWTANAQQETDLLDLFLLEKAAYEICYEAANRPSWLPIPVRGFAGIVQRVLGLAPEMRHA